MDNLPRRSIDDLKLRYELEPSLNDVFVEGSFDREILTACFRDANDTSRVVYTIDSVDVPEAVLRKHSLTEGNKQRVIALAKELGDLQDIHCRFLVDRDTDHWFEDLVKSQGLLWTKYCSLELYFFTEELLEKLIVNVSKCKIGDWKEFVISFCGVLVALYVARLVDRELDLNLKWIDFDKSLCFKSGVLLLDFDSYVSKVLNKNAKMSSLVDFRAKSEEWHVRCASADYKMAIRGHDFVQLLAWTIKNGRGNTAWGTEEAIERAFVLVATSDLDIYSEVSA